MLRFALVLFTLMLLPARANLGETVAQCVARYGRPVGYSEANPHSPFGTVAFSAGGYTLIVFLLSGKEVGARVSKKDNSEFSEAERKNIMSADVGGSAMGPGQQSRSLQPDVEPWPIRRRRFMTRTSTC